MNNMYSWYSFDGRITHLCAIWSIFCDHFTGVYILHLWHMMMLAVYVLTYNIYNRYSMDVTVLNGLRPLLQTLFLTLAVFGELAQFSTHTVQANPLQRLHRK